MTKEESEAFMVMTMQEMQGGFVADVLERSPGYQIIKSRLAIYSPKTKVNDYVLGFLTFVCESPGKLVMYAWMLHNWALKHGFEREITMNAMGMQIIPMGLPTEEALHAC